MLEKILDKIIKYSLYSLVFLFPLWFLPWTISPVVINKQMLLAAFVFLLLIFWMIKIIISGKLSFNWGKLTGAVILFLLALIISTVFSSSKVQSFWGMNFEPDTLFSFILYILLFFLISHLINESGARSLISVFLASSGILALLFLIQLLKPIFPWDFAQSPGFNPIGSVQSLAVFLGGAFVILLTLKSASNQRINLRKIGGIILGILLFTAILLINFWPVWLGIAFGVAIIIFSQLKNLSTTSAANPLRPLFLPLFIFVLALVFIFIKLPIGNFANLPAEISPTYKASFDIALNTLKESPNNLILGSGPSTFSYQYSLHRGIGQNLTDFWYLRFEQGADTLLTFLTTFGILGIMSILLMIIFFFWQGLKNISPAFIGGFYFLISWFFYSFNLSLLFTAFLLMGLWQAVSVPKKEFSFTQSPQKAFFIMLICIILIVGSILGIYNIGQKYTAAVIYSQGLNLVNAKEPKLDEVITKISKAIALDRKDVYLRNLSQLFLLKINEVLNNQELSQEQKQAEFQTQVSSAEISANNAVLLNPKNSQNLFQLGNIYDNFASLQVKGAEELAILSYQKAAQLDPKNPQIPFNMARVYFNSDKKEEAKTELEKSLELKNNFQPALDLMKQIETSKE